MIKLRELRQEKGLNQKELALIINTTQRNVSNWENGNSEPDIQMILKLSKFFEVTVDYFLDNNIELNSNKASTIIEDALISTIKKLPLDKKRALLILLQGYHI